MFKKIALGFAVLVAAVCTYAALQPSHFEISREISIAASPAKVFPYVNTTALANSWNPWLAQDPKAKLEITGPAEGVGAKTAWVAGEKLGTGSATVVESVPNEKVKVKLEYREPFEMTQDAYYFLQADGAGTRVTWKVEGNNTFLSRLMCLFMNMDEMVGDTFAKGLADLKALVEKTG